MSPIAARQPCRTVGGFSAWSAVLLVGTEAGRRSARRRAPRSVDRATRANEAHQRFILSALHGIRASHNSDPGRTGRSHRTHRPWRSCRPLGADFTLWSLRAGRTCRTLGADFALGALSADFALWPLWADRSLPANWSRGPDCALQALCALRSLWPRWPSWTLCPGLATATRERERGHDERNAQQLSHGSLLAIGKRLHRSIKCGQASFVRRAM